jgi:plastocyanin
MLLRTLNTGLVWAALGLLLTATVGCPGNADKPKPKPTASGGGAGSGDTKGPAKPAEKTPKTGSTPANEGTDQAAAKNQATEEVTTGGWGTLSGTFIYEGTPPAQEPVNITKDIEFCSKNAPLSETLVVNPQNKGIQNIVVMLSVGRGDEPPTPHESYAEKADAKVQMDNEFCRFDPHVQFVQAGQTIAFGNEDEMGHNVKGDAFANPPFNQTVAAKSVFDRKLDEAEAVPFPVSCTIHPWMSGWVVVKDHPYVAISGDDGNFELKNVPSGTWTFQLWQEKNGYLKQLKVKGKDTKLSRGRWEIAVHDEAQEGNQAKNSFGDIVVPASNFE